jgi:hypothetical protein
MEFWNSEEKELSVSLETCLCVGLSLDLIRRGSDDLASRATTHDNDGEFLMRRCDHRTILDTTIYSGDVDVKIILKLWR